MVHVERSAANVRQPDLISVGEVRINLRKGLQVHQTLTSPFYTLTSLDMVKLRTSETIHNAATYTTIVNVTTTVNVITT